VTAAGIDFDRGDQLAVVGMPFNTDLAEDLTDELALRESERWRQWIQIALILLGLILLLLLIFFAMRKMNAANEAQTQLIAAAELAAGEEITAEEEVGEPLISPEMTPEALEKKALRAQIDQLIQTNPEEVGKVLKTWLLED
jgi:flagellar M-ring protein FliF